MYRPDTFWSWALFGISITQAAIVLGFEAYVFARFNQDLRGSASSNAYAHTIPTFFTLYIFGFVYQLGLIYDALRLKNTIQVVGLVAYNVGLIIYGAVQMEQLRTAVHILGPENQIDPVLWSQTQPFLIAIPIIIAFATCLIAFTAWKLYDEFAWTIYKHISADLKMKRRYLTYQVYIALLKFDFFFFLGFTVQFVVIVPKGNVEFGLTIAAIPVTIVILFAAAWFVRKENTPGMIGVIVLYFGGMGYFSFKLYRMYESSREQLYIAARKELTTFAVLTILLLLLTIINAIMCTANFKKGLKPYITKRKPLSEEEKVGGSAYAPFSTEMSSGGTGANLDASYARPGPARMEID